VTGPLNLARKVLSVRKETSAISAKRISIGQVMMVIALAAVNLAVTRAALGVDIFPQVLVVLLGSIDFLIIWKLILNRSLRAFHYTFLIVFVVAFFILAILVDTGRLYPLGLLVRWYRQLMGEKTNSISLAGFLRIGELWMAVFLSFTLACAIGLVAAWLERRRGWDIAAFLRGALIGLGISSLFSIVAHAAWGGAEPLFVQWIGTASLGVCLILGGSLGLARLKSKPEDTHRTPPISEPLSRNSLDEKFV
jgi:hypothetical protein